MKERNTYLSSASVKKQGRTAYYKMLESAKQGELIQVRRGVYANIDQLSGNMIDINAVVPEGISNITLNGNAVIYSIDGRRLAQPVKGINIINGKKVYVK